MLIILEEIQDLIVWLITCRILLTRGLYNVPMAPEQLLH